MLSPLKNFYETKETIHGYAKAIAMVPRALIKNHHMWWHASLVIAENGFVTQIIEIKKGTYLYFMIDLCRHQISVYIDEKVKYAIPIDGKLTGEKLGKILIDYLSREFDIDPHTFDKTQLLKTSNSKYNPEKGKLIFDTFSKIEKVFIKHVNLLPEITGPIQIWPHNFDMAVEWYLPSIKNSNESEHISVSSPQINLGFILGDGTHPEPYFYSNPRPFTLKRLSQNNLPHGAVWFDADWQGSLLPYEKMANNKQWEDQLFEYAQKVFQIATDDFKTTA